MSTGADDHESVDFTEILTTGYRGEQPDDILKKCHQLCRDYLGGVWLQIPTETIIVNRITGGLTNQLYYCGLSSEVQPIINEPTEVAIRFYGKKLLPEVNSAENERFKDAVIGVIASMNELCPQIYGLFETGEIAQYYKNRQFLVEQQTDPQLVGEVAKKLAKFHSLKVPIKKNNNLIFELFDDYYETAYKLFPIDDLLEQYNCQTLKNVNVKEEIEWLKRIVDNTNSPIVFTHNDFRGSNILVIDSDTNPSENRILFCDFEYANYFGRGLDLATIFMEWDRPLNEYLDMRQFPPDSSLEPFVRFYNEESARIYGDSYLDDANNTTEKIIYESKVFILVRYLQACLLFMRMEVELNSQLGFLSDKKQQMFMAESSINSYLHLKNIIDDQRPPDTNELLNKN